MFLGQTQMASLDKLGVQAGEHIAEKCQQLWGCTHPSGAAAAPVIHVRQHTGLLHSSLVVRPCAKLNQRGMEATNPPWCTTAHSRAFLSHPRLSALGHTLAGAHGGASL